MALTYRLLQLFRRFFENILENSTPGFTFLRTFFEGWLKLDLTTIAAGLTIFGTITGAFRDLQGVGLKIYWWFTKFFTAAISVTSNDRLNKEILNWIASVVLTRQGTRILTAKTEVLKTNAWRPRRLDTERNDVYHEKRVPIEYLPTFGSTWFMHDRNLFLVRRISSRMMTSATPEEFMDAPQGEEPLIVMCLGRSVQPIKRFFDHCREFADKQRESFITIRTSKPEYQRETWDTTILRPMRSLETVHFDAKVKTALVNDITDYLKPQTRRFYNQRGIPYRRGYLLHGPPGTGKTSLTLALAGYFNLELYLLHLPSVKDDSELERLFTVLPPRCIMLLEDIDAVGLSRQRDFSKKNYSDDSDSDSEDEERELRHTERSRCTLSGLLNVLDGVASQEGRIVCMTSNMADKLDSALVRPGRIDQMIFLGHISPESAELMFLRMYSGGSPLYAAGIYIGEEELKKMAIAFASVVPEKTFTPAQMQGYLLNHRTDPSAAVEGIAAWVAEEQEATREKKARAKEATDRKRRKKRETARKLLAAKLKQSAVDDIEVEMELEKLETKAKLKGKKRENHNDKDLSGEGIGNEETTASLQEKHENDLPKVERDDNKTVAEAKAKAEPSHQTEVSGNEAEVSTGEGSDIY